MKTLIILIISFLLINGLSGQVSTIEDVFNLQKEGKGKKALKAMDELIQSDSPKAMYYTGKAYLLLQEKELDGAIEVLKDGIEIMPDSLNIYDMLGMIYSRLKSFDEALDLYQQAYVYSETPVDKSDYLAMIGGILSSQRKFKEAKNALERGILLDSTNLNLYNNLANVYEEMGELEESLTQLKRIIEIDPDYLGGYINIGYVLQKAGYFKRSLSYFDHAIEMEGADTYTNGYAFSNRSFSKLKLNDLEGAMEDIEQALVFFPSNSYAYKVRALIYIEKGKMKAACKDLQMAINWKYTEEYGPEVKILQAQYCK